MRKVSFSWKPTVSGRETWRWGLFMLVKSRTGRSPRLRIMVRGLLVWLLSLATGAYLLATVSWFFVLNQRPFNYVTLSDCILAPIRWDEIRRKRGDAYIDEGLVSLQERQWNDALHQIRAGLARSPDHWKGRRSLAVFYIAVGRREQGINLLIEGFEKRYQGREAMGLVMQLCLQGEAFEPLLGVLDQSIAHSGSAAVRDREWLVDQKCRVLMLAQKYSEVLDWVAPQDQMSEVRHESKVVALIELERFAEAKKALEEWSQGSGALSGVRRLAVRLAREQKDLLTMRRELALMRDSAPTTPEPWIYSIIQEYLVGEHDAASRAMDQFLLRFDGNDNSLIATAIPLQEIKAWSLFDRLVVHLESKGVKNLDIERLRIEAEVFRDRLAEAKQDINELETWADEWDQDSERWFKIVRAWIPALEDGSQATRDALIATLRDYPITLPFLRDLAEKSEAIGRKATAFSLWEYASQRFSMNSGAQTQVARLRTVVDAEESVAEIELPEIEDGTELDLDSVLPAKVEVDSALAAILQSGVRFKRVAQDYLNEENWAELDRLIREVRRTNPPWARQEGSFISKTEIELNLHNRNWPSLIANLRLSLNGSTEEALAAVKIVRRLDGMEERATAKLVLAEIERRHAGFPLARQIRDDWAAEEAAAASE